MGVMKGYVRNQSRPKGSIVEGYASEEVIDFYTNYLESVKGIGVPQSRHVGRLHGVRTAGSKYSSPDHKLFEIAHFVVLEHMTCVAPYIQEHMETLRAENIGRTDTWYTKRHNEQFATWLKDKVAANMGQPNVDKIVERLGEGSRWLVPRYIHTMSGRGRGKRGVSKGAREFEGAVYEIEFRNNLPCGEN
ncbi:ribonuclease H-like domain-containing protein [Tanacetum coccineum]|uniref:Ribonuclease H-like domain-containing protein n=1 Tax=Tanacetum coccineum TaxID=301880 RepID=A0ABQ5IHP3_9ASTR